ncbi:MAG: cupin domain-containing protein [Anaerolineales bacterium]|jgi:quercetin dioxygenase-like cupin family protein
MYVKDYREVKTEPGGADGLTVRWVVNASQGATNFAMRVFELEPGKETPFHKHENEHEAFVLKGRGEIETDEGRIQIKKGSALFIPSQENHRFRNTGKKVLRFIDVIPFASGMPK